MSKGMDNRDFGKMIKRLHHDNERDIIDGIRGHGAECVILHRVHERNKIINQLLNMIIGSTNENSSNH